MAQVGETNNSGRPQAACSFTRRPCDPLTLVPAESNIQPRAGPARAAASPLRLQFLPTVCPDCTAPGRAEASSAGAALSRSVNRIGTSGARRSAILLQFLLEGLATTLAGGAVGVLLSYVLVWAPSPRPFLSELLDDATRSADIHLVLSLELVGICTAILMVVGLVSLLLPAPRAARMQPIEALRYE